MGHAPVYLDRKGQVLGNPGSPDVKYAGIGYGILCEDYLYRIEVRGIELELVCLFKVFRVEYAIPVSIAGP